ncbi:MAG TPA: saccharopine dehydrogenase NADP-binding domain-containing protein [Solirubrobacteraceae bacterium]|nr:saccharopine dehydrogenase NADP-binding domain-containing protein [Solirubrobacteraceae bacterium]
MPGRIVLFGATGYTGELTARALVDGAADSDQTVVLAARSEARVRTLAEQLGGLDWGVADIADPSSIRSLLQQGDVLVSTVGPFNRWGEAAVQAAIGARAHYLDSTGEGRFIREVFERYGPSAQAAGCGLVTAFGYDWVPGNLAGALALRQAGERATRVRVGYFVSGGPMGPSALSGGTRASAAGVLLDRGFAFRDGGLVEERTGKRVHRFELTPGKRASALSVGSSEHLALPRVHPSLREVDVYLGWFGPATRGFQALSLMLGGVAGRPGAKRRMEAFVARVEKGSSGGPGAATRAQGGSLVLAEALDSAGAPLASVRLEGVNGYDFTARILAWGARTAASGGLQGVGALGPVDGFGLQALEADCAEAGIRRVSSKAG